MSELIEDSTDKRYDFVFTTESRWTPDEPEVTYHIMVWDDVVKNRSPEKYESLFIGMYVKHDDDHETATRSHVSLEDAETFAYGILAAVNNARNFQGVADVPD